MSQISSTNPSRYAGSKRRQRTQSMETVEFKPSQVMKHVLTRPIKRKYKSPYQSVYKFKRTYNYGTVSTDGINPTLTAFNFSINDMPGYTELTTLFDNYKLTGLKFKLIPYQQTQSNSTGSVNNSKNVPIFYVIDRTDSTAPASIDEVLEYNDHKIANAYSGFEVWIPNPRFSDATSALRGGYVAVTNPSLNWYGLKIAIPPTTAATTYYVVVTYYVSMKDPK